MAKTVVGLFDTFAEAQSVVQDLIDSGFSRDQISLVANNAQGEYGNYNEVGSDPVAEGAGTGAIGGTVAGGLLGLLVGAGLLTIPGIGPVLAAGPLAAAIGSTSAIVGSAALGAGIGAATGGLLGALVGSGVPESEANYYTEGVRRGGTLVTVSSIDEMADTAHAIMQRHGAVDLHERGSTWQASGWNPNDYGSSSIEGSGAMNSPTGQDIDRQWQDSSKAGTATGGVTGAATGAAIGSAAGPVGAVIGGVAGAATGAGVGAAGDVAGKSAEESGALDAGADTYTDSTTHSRAASGSSKSGNVRIYDEHAADADVSSRSTGASGYRTTDSDSGTMQGDWEESSKAGTATGGVAGAATGAAIGSAGGPVGAVIGGVAGAAAGAGIGAAGDVAGENAEDSFDTMDTTFRSHYQSSYANSGYTYDDYTPAYRYGYDLAHDPSYASDDWSTSESTFRRDWETRHPGTWNRFKDSIRYAWERTRATR